MNREEAKQLLELCRPDHTVDRQDPALAEAFVLLETDAELKAWFDQQQAVDARISDSINSLEAPADLKASILAGMHLHQANAPSEPTDASIPFPKEATSSNSQRAWWQSPWAGIAALFAIMMVAFTIQSKDSSATQVADADLPPVIQYLSQEISTLKSWQFDKKDNNAGTLQAFLASAQVPSPNRIPNGLENMPTIGCITFDYNEGTKLSMICFKDGEVYHLITADKATYPDTLPEEPQLYQCGDKAFKIWVEGEQVKILSTHGKKEDMPEFI